MREKRVGRVCGAVAWAANPEKAVKKKMSVMGFAFVWGDVRIVAGSVYALNVGLYALLNAALAGMTVLGLLMGVSPDRVARDVVFLEIVGHVLLLSVLVRSSALILLDVGHFLQGILASSPGSNDSIW